jgi:hypothetical protein
MDDSSFSWIFIAAASLIALMALVMMVKIVGRVYWVRRALNEGHRAEGRCVRIYATHSTHEGHTSSQQHYVFQFSTPDGREVRFEDESAPSTTIVGDHVMVAYVPERPEKAAVARAGDRPPYVRAAARLVFLGVFMVLAIGIGFAGSGIGSDF